jgi:hypothetical protein
MVVLSNIISPTTVLCRGPTLGKQYICREPAFRPSVKILDLGKEVVSSSEGVLTAKIILSFLAGPVKPAKKITCFLGGYFEPPRKCWLFFSVIMNVKEF